MSRGMGIAYKIIMVANNKLQQKILTDKSIKRILIVDDEPLILSGLSNALHKLCGFQGEVKTVENGRDAIEEISCCFYDICFLDIKLPDLNGLDVMKKIDELSPETSVAIITALAINDDMKRVIEEGASLFIPKPFDISQVRAFVKQTLEGDEDFYRDQKSCGCGKGFIKGGRQFKRKPFMKTFNYSVSAPDLRKPEMLNLKGALIDINSAGVGILTDYPLEPYYVLRFKEGLWHKAGIVKWSMMVSETSSRDEDNNYRVGIKFV